MSQANANSDTPKIPLPKDLPKSARAKVEAAIEAHIAAQAALIAFLDTADGDADDHADDELDEAVEDVPHDPEPDAEYTWPESHGKGGYQSGTLPDDDEPSLAHTNDFDQTRAQRHLRAIYGWDGTMHSNGDDLEAEHNGREPENHT